VRIKRIHIVRVVLKAMIAEKRKMKIPELVEVRKYSVHNNDEYEYD